MARTIRTKVYKFNELSEAAKQKAICDHIEFILETMNEDSFYFDVCVKMDKLQTPWFAGQYIYDKRKQDVIDDIEANEYDFFINGELYHSKF